MAHQSILGTDQREPSICMFLTARASSIKVGHDSFAEVFNHTGYKGKSARFEGDHGMG